MKPTRDPYASPEAPRERGGPLLRFAIVAVLLGAAAWAFMSFEGARTEQQMADAGGLTAATPAPAPQAAAPDAAPAAAPTPAAPERSPAPSRQPAPATEPVPPPSTTSVPPG